MRCQVCPKHVTKSSQPPYDEVLLPQFYSWSRTKRGLPWWLRWLKHLPAMRETRFDPWVGKIPWRRKWQPTPVLLPGKSHEWRSVVSYSPWNHKEPDTTERLYFLRTKKCNQLSCISYSLLPGLEKYCVNLDSLKYLKMVILSLPHLIFSKITVLVPYITVFRIPGRLFIYLPELFTCDP